MTAGMTAQKKPKFFNRIAQLGRSMVEMPGVLSIVGVLSVGGIFGFSYAMDVNKHNKTLNDVNLLFQDFQ